SRDGTAMSGVPKKMARIRLAPSPLVSVVLLAPHAMLLREVVEVLPIHLRFAGGGADVARVAPEQPLHVALFELGLEARTSVAVAAPGLEAVEVAAAVARGGQRDELDLALAGGTRQVDGPFEHVAKLAHVARPVVGREGRDGFVGHRERAERRVVLRAL